jgi:Tol biopolymer transport system component
MRDYDDAALELRLRGALREHLGALPLDLTVEALDRRRKVQDADRRRRRGLVALGLAAALLVPLGVLAGGGRTLFDAFVVPAPAASPDASGTSEASTGVPIAAPSVAAPSPTPIAQGPWLTAREFMDRLSAGYGYRWSVVDNDQNIGVFEWPSGAVRVAAPLDGPAKVSVAFDVNAAADANQHVDRIVQALAPDAAPWLEDALAQGLAARGPFVSAVLTASGGQVGVTVVDEPVLKDWVSVLFVPDPPPTRALEPDGGLVVYEASGRAWAADRDGTDPGLLVVSPTTPYGISPIIGWSADGSRLLYGESGGGVFAVDTDGSQPFRVGTRRDKPLCPAGVAGDKCEVNENISISPDGTRLAYSLQEGSESDIQVIAVLDVASGGVTVLDPTRASGVDWPTWSPDGTRLLYGCPGVEPRTDGLCIVNADGTDQRRLPPSIRGDISDGKWSPDGSTILFKVDGGGHAELFTIEPDGGGLRSLTSDGLPDFAQWTRDGRIVFVRWERTPAGGPGRGDLRIMDADGSNPSTLGTSIQEQTAAGCIACPYPEGEGPSFDQDHEVQYRYWQPIPGDRP